MTNEMQGSGSRCPLLDALRSGGKREENVGSFLVNGNVLKSLGLFLSVFTERV